MSERDWDALTRRLGLVPGALPSLKRARSFSLSTLDAFGPVLDDAWQTLAHGDRVGFAVAGSLARLEAGSVSDLDPYFVCADDAPEIVAAARAAAMLVRDRLKADGHNVSDGTMFSGVFSPADVCADLGRAEETKAHLTARVLLLAEARAVQHAAVVDGLVGRVAERYQRSGASRGRFWLSIANDLARYWRTLCVDYIHKAEDREVGWAIRNLKLRSVRKIWHVSNMLTFCAATQEGLDDGAELVRRLRQPPLDKIANARAVLGEFSCDFLPVYDEFIGAVHEASTRRELETLPREGRESCATYLRLRERTTTMQDRLTRLVADHAGPGDWGEIGIRQFMF